MTSFEIRIFGVGAILFTPDGKYLMQLRDNRPDVSMRGHWGLFGGVIEEGEDPSAALIRELREELDFAPDRLDTPFSQLIFDLGFAGRGIDRKIFFAVPIVEEAVARMRLGEGQRMALFRLEELLREPRVTPWDLYGVLLHHRRVSVASALRRSGQV
jgi:8-oxo-dGTP pyrophosphatase MutT (NUDIX family)